MWIRFTWTVRGEHVPHGRRGTPLLLCRHLFDRVSKTSVRLLSLAAVPSSSYSSSSLPFRLLLFDPFWNRWPPTIFGCRTCSLSASSSPGFPGLSATSSSSSSSLSPTAESSSSSSHSHHYRQQQNHLIINANSNWATHYPGQFGSVSLKEEWSQGLSGLNQKYKSGLDRSARWSGHWWSRGGPTGS